MRLTKETKKLLIEIRDELRIMNGQAPQPKATQEEWTQDEVVRVLTLARTLVGHAQPQGEADDHN